MSKTMQQIQKAVEADEERQTYTIAESTWDKYLDDRKPVGTAEALVQRSEDGHRVRLPTAKYRSLTRQQALALHFSGCESD